MGEKRVKSARGLKEYTWLAGWLQSAESLIGVVKHSLHLASLALGTGVVPSIASSIPV